MEGESKSKRRKDGGGEGGYTFPNGRHKAQGDLRFLENREGAMLWTGCVVRAFLDKCDWNFTCPM